MAYRTLAANIQYTANKGVFHWDLDAFAVAVSQHGQRVRSLYLAMITSTISCKRLTEDRLGRMRKEVTIISCSRRAKRMSQCTLCGKLKNQKRQPFGDHEERHERASRHRNGALVVK